MGNPTSPAKRTIAGSAVLFWGAILLATGLLWLLTRAPDPKSGPAAAHYADYAPTAWMVSVVGIVALMVAVGVCVNGRPDGLLIDNRNRVSLSRFQAAAWSVLVLSGLATACASNLSHPWFFPNPLDPNGGPLDITIPNELLVAMAISATSLVATPAMLSLKTQDDPLQQDVLDAAKLGGANGADNVGKLFIRNSPKDASWTDMFRGEEVGNVDTPDLSKIQQFLITLVLLGVYAAALLALFKGVPAAIGKLPPIDAQFIWLMGISHAGYLASKGVSHTASADPNAAPAAADPNAAG